MLANSEFIVMLNQGKIVAPITKFGNRCYRIISAFLLYFIRKALAEKNAAI